jgi:hypothetical protein
MKRWLVAPFVVLALAALVYPAPQIDADPQKDYPIDPGAGAYVVVAATYKGPDAGDLARQLVYHLRRDHNLPAYFNYNHADANRTQLEADKQHWKQEHPEIPFRHDPVVLEDQYTVLIGGFDSFTAASDFVKTLRNEKLFPLPPLKVSSGRSAFDTVYNYKTDPKTGNFVVDPKTGERQIVQAFRVSPYASSFASRNPALGAASKAADPFLKVLNAEEDYSLFKCSSPWTMAVQSYSGNASYVPITKKAAQQPSMIGAFVEKLWGGDNKPTVEPALNGAAAQAHETAEVLRKFGFEAYVLHTRHASIVTVGGFNGPADPAMVGVANRLAELKLIDQLHLLKNPTSCEVPRF